MSDEAKSKNPSIDPADRDPCPGCSAYLIEPFIKCSECVPCYLLCLSCFSKGFENLKHLSNHKYEVITNDQPLLEHGWSCAEEMRLLEALSDCGAGNWAAIAKQVRTKTKYECKSHYLKCYILRARYPLPELPHRPVVKMYPPIPFKACEDPCRPLPESHRAQDMAGYLAARSDFTEEHLNAAECDIKDIAFSPNDSPVLKALKLGMVKIYQSRLAERGRRKEIMSLHGIINHGNHSTYLRKLPYELRQLHEQIRPLMRLQSPMDHDKMLAGLTVEMNLIKKILKLQQYRASGITSLRVCRLYDKMKATRRKDAYSSCLTEVLMYKDDQSALLQWLQRCGMDRSEISNFGPIIPARKNSAPIDVTDLPGVEKLSLEEREFCSVCRLVPEAYLRYKSIFITEYEKNGCLKYAQARTLVKIDVNKTKKLHNFMIKQGFISATDPE